MKVATRRHLFNLKGQETLTYRLSGQLHLNNGFPLPETFPFKSEGSLSLSDIR